MGTTDDPSPPASLPQSPDTPVMNSEGPDLLEMVFVALVLVAISYSLTS
ncbi:MAG: hypothetical protein VKK62_07365 [Synechococcaceae cyanobacterium]|nr:hypothetical protein [Synechococcaceae cyanobacterium]